ncbi:MAG: hypothetical protein QOJ16_4718 [Acidobacteriota bacterium]|jgi:hypothetical protein|nr:hypothetical protein [Acidobacteriota bacterium]
MSRQDPGKIFLSYSAADKKVAVRLRQELERQGVILFWPDDSAKSDTELRGTIEEAIRSADAVLVLVGPRGEADDWQRFTWRAALETVWEDPAKPIVPILIGDAKIPTFVYSAGIPFQTVRIDNPLDLGGAARVVAEFLSPSPRLAGTRSSTGHEERTRSRDSGRSGGPKQGAFSVEADEIISGGGNPPTKDSPGMTGRARSIPADIEAERTARLSEIRRYAESLKARG